MSGNPSALFVLRGGLGDVLMTVPAIRAARTATPYVDVVDAGIRSDRQFLEDTFYTNDLIRTWHHGPDASLGPDVIVGHWRGNPAQYAGRASFIPPPDPPKHTAQVLIDMIRLPLSIDGPSPSGSLELNPRPDPIPKFRNAIILAPETTGYQWKRIPLTVWHGLALAMPKPVIVLGKHHDRWTLKAPGIHNFAGRTSLYQVAQLLAGARLLISIDNGIAHWAAAVSKTPILLLAGPTPPWLTGPYRPETLSSVISPRQCAPCWTSRRFPCTCQFAQTHSPKDPRRAPIVPCMQAITKRRVLEEAAALCPWLYKEL